VLCDKFTDAIIRIRPFVAAWQPLYPRIFGNLQRNSVLLPELLQFRHHTVCYTWLAFGVQTVHHALLKINLQSADDSRHTMQFKRSPSTVLPCFMLYAARLTLVMGQHLVADGEIDEVCIHDYLIRWTQLRVVLEV
jgi:hypothetical protein